MKENYVPLYRKYRPQKLTELVGQGHIKKALTNAIESGKIAHAYLFTGPRGTGKTSTARILAKSLNCEKGPTVEPCGECESCVDITNSIPLDVIEIDAASNRKVEDAQNILEKVQYVPVKGKYKIYIIDEVHMLTTQAFNALLKTLEEPPENVIFILATTEVHKVLDTIKSRCQRYDFKRITTEDIVEHLKEIAKKEDIKITDDALFTIASNAAGGMRDSIALLDQLSVLGVKNEITTEDINNLLGRISFDKLSGLVTDLINSNSQGAIEKLEEIYNGGSEPVLILTNLLEYFKNMLIVKNCKKEIVFNLTQLPEVHLKVQKKQVEALETQQIVFLIERVSYYINEVRNSVNPRLWLEVSMVDLANMTENTALIDLQNRISNLEGGNYAAPTTSIKIQAAPPQAAPIASHAAPKIVEKQKEDSPQQIVVSGTKEEPETVVKPTPQAVQQVPPQGDIKALWATLLQNIDSIPQRAFLNINTNPVKISPEEIILTSTKENFVAQINSDNRKQPIVDAADKLFNQKNTSVTIRLPLDSDVKVGKVEFQKTQPKPAPKKELKVEESVEDVMNDVDDAKAAKSSQKKNEVMPSDQVKMAMDLFGGKFID